LFVDNFRPTTTTPFYLGFSNPFNPHEIVLQNYKINPGKFYNFQIDAAEVTTEERFNNLDPTVRKCLLPFENQSMKYFRNYSKSGCQYECALRKAEEICKCIPWLFPRFIFDPS